jgi:hypothetical protein
MEKVLNITVFALALACLFSCRNRPQEEIAGIVAEWSGKEMIFPTGISCTSERMLACVILSPEIQK